jgi:hypothetical protein
MNQEPKSQDHMEVNIKASSNKGGGFLRNLATNIKGPAVSVVLVVWLAAVVLLSIYGKPHLVRRGWDCSAPSS